MKFGIFIVNTGSTSTKLAFYEGSSCLFREDIFHSGVDISSFPDIFDQYEYRMRAVRDFLKRNRINLSDISAIAARGGHTIPIEGGVYRITPKMLSQISSGNFGRHPCDLSSAIAFELAEGNNIIPIVVDPPVTDEFHSLARLSGLPSISRRSRFHALNLKAVARKVADELGKDLLEVNLIGVHMGGGISVCACRKGRMIDCNNALDGDGPYSPERSGSLPIWDLVELCFSGKFSSEGLRRMLVGEGGLVAYLGSKDVKHIEEMIIVGDEKAKTILEGMAYQVAKEVGAMAAVLEGQVDAVFITGGIARSAIVKDWILKRVSFIAPFFIFPGEFEMDALASGAKRILEGEEQIREL